MSISWLVTILFTDLVGWTDLGSEVGDVMADDLRRAHFTLWVPETALLD